MTKAPRPPAPPTTLGASGKALWRRLVGAYEFGPAELPILSAAARQADVIAGLESLVISDGMTVTGAAGQPRLHPAVAEARQGRVALARLLGELSIPDDDAERPVTAAQRRGRRAADVRWTQVAERDARAAARRGGSSDGTNP